ncbi:hypothetical protein [Kineobactrum salinum]|uniref:DUF4282 domain-containing protein n=1 Tax=Kineobactrum salinum TaxID=2708301 RepID=A0A6C0U104_9GAMM|nr:hypothetical protein [Kineobactrum salinum]QIB65711.1 hypothetical protein G3T16_10080 [Kineobactrum salinum]
MKAFYETIDSALMIHYRWLPINILLTVILLLVSYIYDFFDLGIDLVILLVVGQATSGVILCVKALARIESMLIERGTDIPESPQ